MLKLHGIHWSTPGGEEILKGIDLDIPDKELTVITGPNGGGKTSLAKLIAGIYTPSAGKIELDGQDITNWGVTERAKAGVAYAFQQPVRFKGLTVRDLLELSAGANIEEAKLCGMLSTVGLCAQEYINRSVDSSLSGGESKRIEIATVLNRKGASLLVFDEPEAGIDLWSFGKLTEAFERLKREGSRSIVIISHQERIMEIADNIAVVAAGRVRTFGKRADILPELLYGEKQPFCPVAGTKKEVC